MKIAFLIQKLDLTPPLGIQYLSAILKKHNHEVCLIIFKEKDYINQLKIFKPDVLMYSITTGYHKEAIEINKEIKKHIKAYSIFGGPHPTFYPQMIEEEEAEEENINAVCIGEGEYAIIDFLEKLGRGEGEEIHTLNFWVKKEKKIFKNSVRPLIENLDDIPFLDREIIYEKEPFFAKLEIKRFLAGRGCPFSCKYCFNNEYNKLYSGKGKIIRLRSVDNLIKEIKQVKEKYGFKALKFVDDTFNFNKEWLKEFCIKYKEEINLPFICNVRADLLNEDMIKGLAKANCMAIYMGIETGNEKIRKEILNRNMSNEQIIKTCKLLRQNKIKIITQNMLGIPSETLKESYETIYLNAKCKTDFGNYAMFQPYPGTELTKFAIDNNYFDGNFDKLDMSYLHNTSLNYTPKEKKQLENLLKLSTLISKHPFLIPISKLLIKLPKNILFDLIYKFAYGLGLWRVFSKVFGLGINSFKYMKKVNDFIKEK